MYAQDYKIGDKVRIAELSYQDLEFGVIHHGDVYTIKEIIEIGNYCLLLFKENPNIKGYYLGAYSWQVRRI